MDTVSQSTLYNMGCTEGDRIESGSDPANALVILAFGAPVKIDANTYGADLPGNAGSYSLLQIRQGVQEYFHGAYACIPSSVRDRVTLKVSIGVNNDYPGPWTQTDATDYGNSWGSMVNNANNWLATYGYNAIGNFNGGGDLELGFSAPGMARSFVDGYDTAPGAYFLFNFGGAAGCQDFSSGDEHSCGTPGFPSWESSDVYYITYGSGISRGQPEIYRNDGQQAEQWVMISKWAVNNSKPKVDFSGPLTQSGACGTVGCGSDVDNTPTQGWNQMVDKMDARPPTIDDMDHSCDIDWH